MSTFLIGLPDLSVLENDTNRTLKGLTKIGVGIGDGTIIGSVVSTTNIHFPTIHEPTIVGNQIWEGSEIFSLTPMTVNGQFTFLGSSIFDNATFTGDTNVNGSSTFHDISTFNNGIHSTIGTTHLGDQQWSGDVTSTGTVHFAGSVLDFSGASVTGLNPIIIVSFNNITTTGLSNIGVGPSDVTNLGGIFGSEINIYGSTLGGITTINQQVWNGSISSTGPISFAGSILDFAGASISGIGSTTFFNTTLSGLSTIGVGAGEETIIGSVVSQPTSITKANLSDIVNIGILPTDTVTIGNSTVPSSIIQSNLSGNTNIGILATDVTVIGNTTNITSIINADITGSICQVSAPSLFSNVVNVNGLTSLSEQKWSGPVSTTGTVNFAGSTLDFTGSVVTGLPVQTSFNDATLTGTSSIGVGIGESTFIGSATSTVTATDISLVGNSNISGSLGITAATTVSGPLTVSGQASLNDQIWSGSVATSGPAVTFVGSLLDFSGATVSGLSVNFNNATLTGSTNIGVANGEVTNIGGIGATSIVSNATIGGSTNIGTASSDVLNVGNSTNQTSIINSILSGGTIVSGAASFTSSLSVIGLSSLSSQNWSGPIASTGVVSFAGSSLDFSGASVVGLPVQTLFNNATLTGISSIGIGNAETTLIGSSTSATTITDSSLTGQTIIGTNAGESTIIGNPLASTNLIRTILSNETTIGVFNGDNTLIGSAVATTEIVNAKLSNATSIGIDNGDSTIIGSVLGTTLVTKASLTGSTIIGVGNGDSTDIGSPSSSTTIYNSILNGSVINNTSLNGVVSIGILPGDTTIIGDALSDTEIVKSVLSGSTSIGIANGDVTVIGSASSTTSGTNVTLGGTTTIAGSLQVSAPTALSSTLNVTGLSTLSSQSWNGPISSTGQISFSGSSLDFNGASVVGLPVQSLFSGITVTGSSSFCVGSGDVSTIGGSLASTNIINPNVSGTSSIGLSPADSTTIGGSSATTSIVKSTLSGATSIGVSATDSTIVGNSTLATSIIRASLSDSSNIGIGPTDSTTIGNSTIATTITNASLIGPTTISGSSVTVSAPASFANTLSVSGLSTLGSQDWSGAISTTGTVTFNGSILNFTGASVSGLPVQTSFNSITVSGSSVYGIDPGESSSIGGPLATTNIIKPVISGASSIGISAGDSTVLGGLSATTSIVNSTLSGATSLGVSATDSTTIGNSSIATDIIKATLSGVTNLGINATDSTTIGNSTVPTSIIKSTLSGETNIGITATDSTSIGNSTIPTVITRANLVGPTNISGSLLTVNSPSSLSSTLSVSGLSTLGSQDWSGSISTSGTVTFAGSILDFTGASVSGLPAQTIFNNATLTGASIIGIGVGESTTIGSPSSSVSISNAILSSTTSIGASSGDSTILGSSLSTTSIIDSDMSGISNIGVGATDSTSIGNTSTSTSITRANLSNATNIGITGGDVTTIGSASSTTSIVKANMTGLTSLAAQNWSGGISTTGSVSFSGSVISFVGASVSGLIASNCTFTGTTSIGVGPGEVTNIGHATGNVSIVKPTFTGLSTFSTQSWGGDITATANPVNMNGNYNFTGTVSGLGIKTETNPIANNVVVYADASGNHTTANTTALLAQPLNLTFPSPTNTTIPLVVVSDVAAASTFVGSSINNTNATRHGSMQWFGKPLVIGSSLTWGVCMDPLNTGQNVFAVIRNNAGGTEFSSPSLMIDGTDLATFNDGISTISNTLRTSVIVKPNAVWLNTASNTRPQWSSLGTLALTSDLPGMAKITVISSNLTNITPATTLSFDIVKVGYAVMVYCAGLATAMDIIANGTVTFTLNLAANPNLVPTFGAINSSTANISGDTNVVSGASRPYNLFLRQSVTGSTVSFTFMWTSVTAPAVLGGACTLVKSTSWLSTNTITVDPFPLQWISTTNV